LALAVPVIFIKIFAHFCSTVQMSEVLDLDADPNHRQNLHPAFCRL